MSPLCKCHGVPMRWAKDSRPRYKQGGYWRCAVKQRAKQDAYSKTEKARARGRVYNNSPKGRARRRRYLESPGGWLTRQLNELARIRVRY